MDIDNNNNNIPSVLREGDDTKARESVSSSSASMSYGVLEELLLDSLKRYGQAHENDLLDVGAQQQLLVQLKTIHGNLAGFEESMTARIDASVAKQSASTLDGYAEYALLAQRHDNIAALRATLASAKK